MDEHIIEALGKARVVIRDGKVVEVGEPQIGYCPLFDKHRGIKKLTKEEVRKNMQFRIDDFGMCRPDRILVQKDWLSFGISEIISTGIRLGLIDVTIMVLEGAGTVLITDPDIAQGVGGRVSALIKTTPIPELIERFGKENVLDPETARIDSCEGVMMAIKRGYKNIAVSVISGADAKKFKDLEKEYGINIYTFVVHTTGMCKEDAEDVYKYADVATGCASKYIRELGAEKGVYKVGDSVPIFGVTPRGRHLIEERIKHMGKPVTPKPGAPQPDKLL